MNGYDTIVVGKGKKMLSFDADTGTGEDNEKEEIIKTALGRTGNLRAPAIDVGGTLYVGYNETLYDSLLT